MCGKGTKGEEEGEEMVKNGREGPKPNMSKGAKCRIMLLLLKDIFLV